MELSIWLLYLETNNVLERDRSSGTRTVAGSYSPLNTRFIGDVLVEEVLRSTPSIRDAPSTTFSGIRYPGLGRLDEHQAYYLFHRFAKPSFALFADRVPISKDKDLADFIHKDVAADAFASVLEMQKTFFLTGDNEERSDLVKEMGVIVIEFFNFLRDSVAERPTLGFSDAIPEGTKIGDLLANIQKPEPVEPPSATAPAILASWQDEQDAARLADWEERMLDSLLMLETDYDAAVQRYDAAVANAGKYSEAFTTEEYEDLFMGTPTEHLSTARKKIQAQIYRIRNDPKHQATEPLEERVDVLDVKLRGCPLPPEFGSTRLPD